MSISINKIYALLSVKEENDIDAVLLRVKKEKIEEHIKKVINSAKEDTKK